MINLKELKTHELIELYPAILEELKDRDIIRTKNIIGELGEYLAINYYYTHSNLPNLQAAPIGTQNIDAISKKGERYSIKSTSSNVTGVFFGLNPKGVNEADEKKFEYVIICSFDKTYCLKAIYELSWENFIKHKKWHSRMKAWYLTLTKALKKDCAIIFEAEPIGE